MTGKRNRAKFGRKSRGSAIAEFGPALGIILIFFFFPMIDFLSVGMSYGFLMVLNYNQVHEASLLPASAAQDPNGSVKKAIPNQWLNGMGQFVKMSGSPQTTVAYRNGVEGSDTVTDKIVSVTTAVVCNPFLTIPLPCINVPGLNGPMNFSVTSERPMENPDDPGQ
jgi:hypothetical protein